MAGAAGRRRHSGPRRRGAAGKAPLPASLVAIHRIDEPQGIAEADVGLWIGALATHAELAAHSAIRERFTALADASAIVGPHATRAQGTLGGNPMNACPRWRPEAR